MQFDGRSGAARTGLILFGRDGRVDARCAGVRSGAVIVTKSGGVDKRSQVVRSGQLKLKTIDLKKEGKKGKGASASIGKNKMSVRTSGACTSGACVSLEA